jgi:hypothetical protein
VSDNTSIIVADKAELPIFAISDTAKELREMALSGSALIAKVTNADQNAAAVNAQRELKRVMALFEKTRKTVKEPLLEAGRQLDRLVAAESLELEKEFGRVSQVLADFQVAEQERVREEERLQRAELERIEREKQAELRRIEAEQRAREEEARKVQAEIDRKAREAQESAERLAREANNAKQRAAAEAARIEAEKQAAAAEVEAAKQRAINEQAAKDAAAAATKVIEAAAAATYSESRPVQSTREQGQVVKVDWDITVTNPYELAKFHPDCVKIEPLMTPIKAALNEGRAVKGIKAEKKTVASVRVNDRAQKVIDV